MGAANCKDYGCCKDKCQGTAEPVEVVLPATPVLGNDPFIEDAVDDRQAEVPPKRRPAGGRKACTSRWPVVGDAVYQMDDKVVGIKDSSGNKGAWKLPTGEKATVVEVDEDGDFKLRNPAGVVSGWTLRKYYSYDVAKVEKSDQATETPSSVAAAVRQLAQKEPAEAWVKLAAEFETQKLIWSSVLLTKGQAYRDVVSQLEAQVDLALRKAAADPNAAVAALCASLETSKEARDGPLLSKCTSDYAEAVIRAVTLAEPRRALASRVAAGEVSGVQQEIEVQIEACELGTQSLKDSVLKVLVPQMQAPSGKGNDAAGARSSARVRRRLGGA